MHIFTATRKCTIHSLARTQTYLHEDTLYMYVWCVVGYWTTNTNTYTHTAVHTGESVMRTCLGDCEALHALFQGRELGASLDEAAMQHGAAVVPCVPHEHLVGWRQVRLHYGALSYVAVR